MLNNELKNKAICSLCDRIFDPNLFIVNTIILLGPNSGLSNKNEFVICRECYKNAVEELVDYPENRKYKRIHDPIEYIDSKGDENENQYNSV